MNDFNSTYLKCFLATMLSVLLLSSVHSQDQIKPHIANYEVNVRGIKGNLDTTLNTKENVYVAKNELNASGIASIFLRGNVEESSTFSILNSDFLPVSFSSFDTMSKEEKSISIRFEKNKNLISSIFNGEKKILPYDQNTFDRLSLKYALMLDLSNQNLLPQYKVFEGENTKIISVEIIESKILNVPYGEFKVIGIKNHEKGSSKRSILWCAEELDYLPVVIEQYRNEKLWMQAKLSYHEFK